MDFKPFTGLLLLGLTSGLAAQERQVLDTLPLDSATAYELSLPACTTAPCPFELRLLQDGRRHGTTLALPWAATAAPASLAAPDPLYGAGTPLGADAAPRVWITGEEEGQVSAAARLLRLADGTPALLVSQMGGFEHPKRHHALYLATPQGPHLAWSHDEAPGPNQSWVLAPTGDGPVLLVHEHAAAIDTADRLETRRLTWHPDRTAFTEAMAPPSPALRAVVAERHPSAMAARDQQEGCLAAYAVIDTGAPAAARYALAQVAESDAEAQTETTRLYACAATLRPETVPLAQLSTTPAPKP
ncbi:hypothetical protein A7D27_15830 [Pseudomonas sp. 1D4]|uniref:hypothetical protein n=1 Tax=unclassified Pseudomonas TaxID=196821 RepID=UPI00084AF759|nr:MULTISPECIES: hypothetical protein [unclassified Pseudomonas]OEC40503.1 hypothetical protein A7D27_15830 [Pseudomonas sp. 1D4]OEC61065.1 hypothetical protein A9G05_04770 [Pseudomonas sp. ENNP23]